MSGQPGNDVLSLVGEVLGVITGSNDRNKERNNANILEILFRGVALGLPDRFFRTQVHKEPVAPVQTIITGYTTQVGICSAGFAILVWIFSNAIVEQINISPIPIAGQDCSVLNPKRGTIYYSSTHSENAQFASPYMKSYECVSFLRDHGVCDDGKRVDHLMLLGVLNPNNSQYYPTGHFSFTPTQSSGLSTSLSPFYGKSVSFPQPPVGRDFQGSEQNWYTYSFSKNVTSGAFTVYPGTPVPSLLRDSSSNKVYDGSTGSAVNYDFSLSRVDTTASNNLKTLRTALGLDEYIVVDIGMFDGVYYGIVSQALFDEPYGVAVRSQCVSASMTSFFEVYVAEHGANLVSAIMSDEGKKNHPHDVDGPYGVAATSYATCPAPVNVNVYVTQSTGVVNGGGITAYWAPPGISITTTSSTAKLNVPWGLAVDYTTGDLYIASVDAPDGDPYRVVTVPAAGGAANVIGGNPVPGFLKPTGVAVDLVGNVYVADRNSGLVRKISVSGGAVTNLGESAIPAFNEPRGIAVDSAGKNVYVADTGNNLVRKIDLASGIVTNLGESATPTFNGPLGVAVDYDGNVYVADTGNNLVRMIDRSTGEMAGMVGRLRQPMVVSYDTKGASGWNPAAPIGHLFSSDVVSWVSGNTLAKPRGQLIAIAPIDSSEGRCRSLESFLKIGTDSWCFYIVHSEHNSQSGRIYVELLQHKYVFPRINAHSTRILILNPAATEADTHFELTAPATGKRQLWGVFNTANGVILYTSRGTFIAPPDTSADFKAVPYLCAQYNALVTAAGTTVLDGSSLPGGIPRYLMLMLNEKSAMKVITYDTATDTYFFNSAAAATTHYMIAFTYGVCDNVLSKNLVELTFSNDYSNQCQLPRRGIYYQSENRYYAIPYTCLGIAYDKLLIDCPEIKANMKTLVDTSCHDSIDKVCRAQYTDNPPFACVETIYNTPLTIFSLAVSTTLTLASAVSFFIVFVITRIYHNYRATEAEITFYNHDDHSPAHEKPGDAHVPHSAKIFIASDSDHADDDRDASMTAELRAARAECNALRSQLSEQQARLDKLGAALDNVK